MHFSLGWMGPTRIVGGGRQLAEETGAAFGGDVIVHVELAPLPPLR
jgi:hypothetical protein